MNRLAEKIRTFLQNKSLRWKIMLSVFLAIFVMLAILIFTLRLNINAIENKQKYFDYRLYRKHTVMYNGDLVKDLSKLGRDLSKIIIVDNMPQNFKLQKENGILISSFWGEDTNDKSLFYLGKILVSVAIDMMANQIGQNVEGFDKIKQKNNENSTQNHTTKKGDNHISEKYNKNDKDD